MKKMIEIFIVVFIIFNITYTLLFFFYFDTLCGKYSWKDANISTSFVKLATCKDSIICYPDNIDVSREGSSNSWDCFKKDAPVFWKQSYERTFENFINTITK